mmetsp:Transcript_21084/g.47821  ORF Transcript_21084/g.47821 Transcript_21084/m.47821 type:complete len:190 (-) Transcript_21084:543-1112(-)
MMHTLGVTHNLHRRKIMLAIEKLRLNIKDADSKISPEQETLTLTKTRELKDIVETKEGEEERLSDGPESETNSVLSYVRYGKLKKVEDFLQDGYPVDDQDECGNTLLIVAVQNSRRKMVELLLKYGGKINHVNKLGNGALHYAFAYDGTGEMAQFLISQGADDSIENVFGLTPYDGLEESDYFIDQDNS